MQKDSKIILGFDFGTKYIGIAVGQTISKTATPLKSLIAKNGTPDWSQITNIINEWKPSALLIGNPLNMDGTTQAITTSAENFAQILKEKYNLPIYMVDERLSTWEAKNKLNLNKSKLNKKEITKINSLSAVILVEQWLQHLVKQLICQLRPAEAGGLNILLQSRF